MSWTVIIILLLIAILLFCEYKNHDCINGKKCSNYHPSLASSASIEQLIESLEQQIRSNCWYTFWRQALLVGLIVCIPVIYFITHQLPTWSQALIVVLIVSVATFFSQSWIFTHFTYPNTQQIEKNLQLLADKI